MSLATRAIFTGNLLLPALPTTAGSIAVVTDDTKYNAFVTGCRIPNQDILAAYTKADTHHADNSGKAVFKRSSNEGASFGSEVTIYDDASLWVSVFGMAMVRQRLYATLWRDNPSIGDTTGEAGLAWSDDNGATWPSGFVPVTSSFTQASYGTSPVIESHGNLLYNVEGSNTGDPEANRSSHVVLLSHSGVTLDEYVVRDYATDSRPYYESKLVRLRDRRILILHRTSAGPGDIFRQYSTNEAQTWDTPAFAFEGFGAPSVTRLRGDGLIAVTRRNSDSACIAYPSRDSGATWDTAIEVDATMDQVEYGAAVELQDGRVLFLYGHSPNPLGTNCDVKSAIGS